MTTAPDKRAAKKKKKNFSTQTLHQSKVPAHPPTVNSPCLESPHIHIHYGAGWRWQSVCSIVLHRDSISFPHRTPDSAGLPPHRTPPTGWSGRQLRWKVNGSVQFRGRGKPFCGTPLSPAASSRCDAMVHWHGMGHNPPELKRVVRCPPPRVHTGSGPGIGTLTDPRPRWFVASLMLQLEWISFITWYGIQTTADCVRACSPTPRRDP